MANLDTSQAITASSTAITYTAVGGSGDRVLYAEGVFLILRNGSGSPTTATITVPGNERYGTAKPAKAVTVAAATDVPIPLLSDYVDPTDGRVLVTCSPTTTITVAILRK